MLPSLEDYRQYKRRIAAGGAAPPVEPPAAAEDATSSPAAAPSVSPEDLQRYQDWKLTQPPVEPVSSPRRRPTILPSPVDVSEEEMQFGPARRPLNPFAGLGRAAGTIGSLAQTPFTYGGGLLNEAVSALREPLGAARGPGGILSDIPGKSFREMFEEQEERGTVNRLLSEGAIPLPGPGLVKGGFQVAREVVPAAGRAAGRVGAAAREAVPLARPVGRALAAGKQLNVWKETRDALEGAASPELKPLITQRFVDWEAAYRKMHPSPLGGAYGGVTSQGRGPTSVERYFRQFQRDFAKDKDAFIARLYNDYPQLRAGSTPPPQTGAIQAGMGIGEQPAQGTLGLGGRIAAQEPVPLIDAEQVVARQRLLAEAKAGQRAFPKVTLTPDEAMRQTVEMEAFGLKAGDPFTSIPQGPGLTARLISGTIESIRVGRFTDGTPNPTISDVIYRDRAGKQRVIGVEQLAAERAAGQQALPEAAQVVPPRRVPTGFALPSGRIPGAVRAEPLGANPPPPPRGELPALSAGGLPSGRVPGKGGTAPPPRDPYEQVKAALEPEKEPLLARIRQSLPHEFYDRNYALRDLQKRTGVAAHDLIKIVPGSQAAGEDIIRRFYIPALEPIKGRILDLERLMVIRRMGDILRLHPGSHLPGGLTGFSDIQKAEQQLIKQVGAGRFQQVDDVANELWRLNDEQVLKPLLDEGILSETHYLALKTGHPHYIPFQRADFVDVIDRSFGGRAEANLSTTGIKILTVEGSQRALDNPLLRLAKEPIKAQSIIFRNRAAKAMVEALEVLQTNTGESLVEYIEPRRAMNIAERVTGERLPRAFKAERSGLRDTISFYKDGVKNTVEVPAIYGQIAKGMSAEPDNILLKAVQVLNAPLRKGAVELNPFFTPVNIIRDAMSALFREKVFPFGPDYLAGLWAAIRKNSLFSEAAKEGALLSGIVETMKNPTVLPRPLLGAIQLQNLSDAALLLPRLLVAVPRSISGINVIAERGVRLGTYRQLKRQGLPSLEAAVRSRDVTVDFSQAGHTMRVINLVIPFSNAVLQGSALIARTIRGHPIRSAVFATFAASAAMAERLNNMRFETSEDIPDYEYTRNWIFQFGEGTRTDKTRFPIYVRIPKGEIVGLFTFPVEAMFNLARKTEDRSAAELMLTAGLEQAKVISPIDPDIAPSIPFIQTAYGLSTKIDPFTKNPIIPRGEQNLLPEQQFGPETSAVAISIGKATKVSPRLIDFGIKDYLAGVGTTSNWLISAGLEAAGWRRPAVYGEAFKKPQPEGAEAVSRTPVGRFVGTRATQQERRGWQEFRRVVAETNREFRKIPEMERLGIRLSEVGDSINKVELTPRQRAIYQQEYANRAILHVRGLRLYGTDQDKKNQIKNQLDSDRESARQSPRIKAGQKQGIEGPEWDTIVNPTPISW